MKFPSRKDLPVYEYSENGFEKLVKDIEALEQQRPHAVEDLAKARGMGDLSENGYYKAARAKLSFIDSQLKRLRFQHKYAKVIKKKNTDTVDFGSQVEVEVMGKTRVFTIVGKQESNPMEGTLSLQSPIGKALFGKKTGETVFVNAPSGKIEYKIISVR